MKAWMVSVPDEWGSTVVFAETRGKARSIAMHTETCADCEFIDIEVRRKPQLDKYYRGLNEMDWYNPKDRIALVKECGFQCHPDYWELEDCTICSAKQYCDGYVERSGD